ncbi:MAG: MFS transporter [Candidatus Omnitrophica bacterium]|nr:MFS transporter [Candidatus Omnitrophota bacterium]
MFSSLKVREFRIFWFSMVVSLIGTWVQSMAQSWLVFKLTGSAFLLGLVGFLAYLPISLFSFPSGVFIDRVVKRNLLIVTQAVFTLLAFVLAYLVQRDMVQVWHIMAIAVLSGLAMAVDAPARQAMVVELVGKQHLFNAIVLNSAAFNTARLIGPALAGVLIAVVGMAGCFYVNAFSYIPVLAALFFIRPTPAPVNVKNKSFLSDIRNVVDYIRKEHFLLALFAIVAMFSLFGSAYIILMPIFAQEILHSGANGLAILMSASGAGALIGVLNLARLKHTASNLALLKFCMGLFFASIMVFACSGNFILSAFMLFLCGFGGSSGMSIVNTLLQMSIPDEYRGRIMGVFVMMFTGFMPIGNLFAGALAHFIGAPHTVFLGSATSLVVYFIIAKKYLTSSPQRVVLS